MDERTYEKNSVQTRTVSLFLEMCANVQNSNEFLIDLLNKQKLFYETCLLFSMSEFDPMLSSIRKLPPFSPRMIEDCMDMATETCIRAMEHKFCKISGKFKIKVAKA